MIAGSFFLFAPKAQAVPNPFPYAEAPVPSSELVDKALIDLSVPFIENQGQVGDVDDVAYYVQTISGTVFVGPDGLTYALPTSAIKEHFISNTKLDPKGTDQAVTKVSYFKGSQDQWKSDLPSFNTIEAGTLWPGIDVSLKASHQNIEKIFTVAPNANPKDIKLSIEGATISLSSDGPLILHTEAGDVSMTKPVAYQDINQHRVDVAVNYSITNQTYSFTLGDYNHSYPLIIDPLIASTYIGGTVFDSGSSIASDSSGNIYINGTTTSSNFPTTAGAYDQSYNDTTNTDVFVAKFNST